MRKISAAAALAALILLAAAPAAFAQDIYTDQVVFGGAFTLRSGETVAGDLVVFGGAAYIEPEAVITGDMIVFGGAADIAGAVHGDLLVFGGHSSLYDTGSIGGDVVRIGGNISKAAGAIVSGSETSDSALAVPDVLQTPLAELGLVTRGPFGSLLQQSMQALLWSVGLGMIGLLLFLFIPEHLNHIGEAVIANPLATGGLGMVTMLLVPVLSLGLALTIILIPLSLLGLLLFFLALTVGWLGMGALIGQRMMASSVIRGSSPALAAALGVFVLTLVFRVLALAPRVGFIFVVVGLLLAGAGLGAVVLTRFGTGAYGVLPPALARPQPATDREE